MDGTDENPTSEETPATTELVPSEPDGEMNESSESDEVATESEHPGVRKIQRLRMVWVVYMGVYYVLSLGFSTLEIIRLKNKGLLSEEVLEQIENGFIEQNAMATVVSAGLFIGLVWWIFGFLVKGYGWVRILFLAVASLILLQNALGLVTLMQMPDALPAVLPEMSETTELYYKEHPQFYLLAIGLQAFGYGLAFAKHLLFSLASLAMAGWFWRTLMTPDVSSMLREAKEARQQAKQEKA